MIYVYINIHINSKERCNKIEVVVIVVVIIRINDQKNSKNTFKKRKNEKKKHKKILMFTNWHKLLTKQILEYNLKMNKNKLLY